MWEEAPLVVFGPPQKSFHNQILNLLPTPALFIVNVNPPLLQIIKFLGRVRGQGRRGQLRVGRLRLHGAARGHSASEDRAGWAGAEPDREADLGRSCGAARCSVQEVGRNC